MSMRKNVFVNTAACVLTAAALSVTAPAQASETGAFIGGVFATKLLGNMKAQTQAQQVQAYNSSRPQSAPQQAAPAAQTPEERIKQLDKLAAGGYITPAEYKQKKQAILDSM